MAYSDVEWSNGDYLTELKLDTMQGNTDHVREEGNYKGVCPIMFYEGDQASSVGSVTLDIEIDTTTVGAQQSGTGSKGQADLDISSFSTGLHILHVTLSGSTYEFYDRFVKTADLDRLSYWCFLGQRNDGGTYYNQLQNFRVILHKDAQGW